eukprot:8241482-Pyramimonas_sp.AAC.2
MAARAQAEQLLAAREAQLTSVESASSSDQAKLCGQLEQLKTEAVSVAVGIRIRIRIRIGKRRSPLRRAPPPPTGRRSVGSASASRRRRRV